MGLAHVLATDLVKVLPWWDFPPSSKGTNFGYPFTNSPLCIHSIINNFSKFSFIQWAFISTSLL